MAVDGPARARELPPKPRLPAQSSARIDVVDLGNDVTEVMEARPRACEENDVVRIVFAVEERANDTPVRDVIVGHAKSQIGVKNSPPPPHPAAST
jgi:hypothetical protein